MAEFETILKDAWFEPFPGKGFKHVFVGKYLNFAACKAPDTEVQNWAAWILNYHNTCLSYTARHVKSVVQWASVSTAQQ